MEKPLAEDSNCVGALICSPQGLLSPTPYVRLQVEVRRTIRPVRQSMHPELGKSRFVAIRVKQGLAVEQNPEARCLRVVVAKEGSNSLPNNLSYTDPTWPRRGTKCVALNIADCW